MSKEVMKQLLQDNRSEVDTDPKVVERSRDALKAEAGTAWESIKEELSHLGKQGAHELASALFVGSAFVMYPGAPEQSVEQDGHGLHGKAIEPPEPEIEM